MVSRSILEHSDCQMPVLDLGFLGGLRNAGVSREVGNSLAQAGAVCLVESGHRISALLHLRGVSANIYRLRWGPITPVARRSWNDLEEATEYGAAGVAILLANSELGQEVILRSRKGTGFDYWLGDRRTGEVSDAERQVTSEWSELLLDDGLVVRGRMEVSGILRGSDSRIAARVREKLEQIASSNHLRIPAYVFVVEFGQPIAEVRMK